MTNIIQKLFGDENMADEIAQLDEQLRIAIEDIKKLEEDWHRKVEQVNGFIKNWDKKWNLIKLKENIRVIEEIERDEKEVVTEEKKSVLKIKIIKIQLKKR